MSKRPAKALPAPQPWPFWIVAAFLMAATWAAYSNSFEGALVHDDLPAIAQNPFIESVWPLSRSLSAPSHTTASGRPALSLSLALSRVFGDPRTHDGLAAFHVTNLIIHVTAGLLLFAVARRTLERPVFSEAVRDAATPLAAAIALLWLLHPLQTASVTYVIQRAEALMGLCVLAVLYCSIRAHEARHRAWWTAGAIVACVIGVGAKEATVVAPVLVVMWDWVFAKRLRPRLYLGLLSSWVLLGIQIWSGPRADAVGFGFAQWPWWRYLATQAGVILHYLRLAVTPYPLVFDYGWPPVSSVGTALAQLAIVGLLFATSMFGFARRHPVGFDAAAFFVILTPTSSILPIVTEIAAEHRMYLPLAAVIGIIVVAAFEAGRQLRLPGVVGYALVLVTAATFGVATHARNRDYASEATIWRDTVDKRPANPRARLNYGVVLLEGGRASEAERHLREAVALDPNEEDAHLALGTVLCSASKCDGGLPHFERAAALDPNDPKPLRNLAEAHAAHGRFVEAAAYFRRALALSPNDLFLLNRASWLLATSNDPRVRDVDAAQAYAERAVTLTDVPPES